MLVEYLDHLPRIPEFLIPSVYKCLEQQNLFSNKKIHNRYGTYQVTSELGQWLKTLFAEDHMFKIQRVEQGLHPHIDKSRICAYNYLLDTGGSNAALCYYDKTGKLIEKHQISPHRWHRIDVTQLHTVTDILTTRIAITVFKPIA